MSTALNVQLDENVDRLVTASKQPAKERSHDVSELVNSICEYAYDRGLPEFTVAVLCEMLTTKTTLDQSNTTTLIKELYPAQRVSSQNVLLLISCLGQGKRKPSPATQASLLDWLYKVYHVLEEPAILSRAYSTLFGLLDMLSLRSSLCHLLALITRRRHVRPFRIQQLLELQRSAAPVAGFEALLRTYKDYYPDVVSVPTSRVRVTTFIKGASIWRGRLADIQSLSNPELREQQRSAGALMSNGHNDKRGGGLIPQLHTARASESSVTLEEIRDSSNLVQNLEKISLPSQMVSALDSFMVKRYLRLCPSQSSTVRMEFWLAQFLEEALELTRPGSKTADSTAEILQTILRYVENMKTTPPLVMTFLREFLPLWEGTMGVASVLEIVSYLPALHFHTLHDEYLRFVESSLGRRNPYCLELLSCLYEKLLQRHVMSIPTSQPQADVAFVRDLLAHVGELHLSALVSLSEGNWTTSSIVRFYETLSHRARAGALAPTKAASVMLPAPPVVYLLAFSFQLDAMSRLCGILTTYKAAFEAGIKAAVRWPVEFTSRFNGYLMDICNLLWRSRALTAADANSMGCMCPESILGPLRSYLVAIDREYNLASTFGLSHNVLICNQSFEALQQLEKEAARKTGRQLSRHVGPANQRTLAALEKEGGATIPWKEYRVEVLQWMDRHGVSGMKQLMFVTMKDLMKAPG